MADPAFGKPEQKAHVGRSLWFCTTRFVNLFFFFQLCAQVSGRGDDAEIEAAPSDSVPTPFGGMVLDLTSELGGLVPPLLVANQSKISPVPTVSPPPPPEPPPPGKPNGKPPSGKAKPEPNEKTTKNRPQLRRPRPRPSQRPATVVESAARPNDPPHSLSASHLSAAVASTSASFTASESSSTLTGEESFGYSSLLDSNPTLAAPSNRFSAPPLLEHVVVFDAENQDGLGSFSDVVLRPPPQSASRRQRGARRSRPLSSSDSWDASLASSALGRLV